MSGCGCGGTGKNGPFSKGRDLVEFVYNAHNGAIRDQPIRGGGLQTKCQGCGKPFTLETYLGECPHCNGVHAVAPMDPSEKNIQFGGPAFSLEELE